MDVRGWSAALLGLAVWAAGDARGQAPSSAKIESIPLELTAPDRYQIYSILEPIRHISVTAPVDGILRSLEFPVGSTVRERQEIGQFDRAEAAARLKIAQANVKEAKAALSNATNAAVAQAQLEAAQARVELAELEVDRCTLRAPFAGRLLDLPVHPGQYLAKGAKIAELADVSSLRVLVPFARSSVSVGGTITVSVEGQPVSGKIQATLPLPESLATLHELSTAFTAAWVILPNPKGDLEPGQRVLGPSLPTAPLATIPSRAIREPEKGEPGGPRIQLIRNEYVTNLPVRILGRPGPERVQISGLLRPNDALIVSSSVPLAPGTLIRFGGGASPGIEATNPNPAEGGDMAGITPPRAGTRSGSNGAVAKGRTSPRPSTSTSQPAAKDRAAPPF
jgi:multidrug efflux pump subunit AcrA (membrane-fusion protein)